MMPGAKGLKPHKLARRWVEDLGTRQNIRIKMPAEIQLNVISTKKKYGITNIYKI